MPHRSLQDFVESAGGGSHLRVEHDFGDGFVRLRTSEAERRQAAQDIQSSENVLLELMRNSKDAHASHVFIASSREGDKRVITVIDDGDGIPPSMHEHVFEPRVTSKLDTSHMDAWGLHGRGMALFSIATNAEDAGVISSAPGLGCSIQVTTDLNRLPERKDQSSFPTFEMTPEGTVNVRGPRNLLRTACEFALETRKECSLYVGSPAEVMASLVAYGNETLPTIDRLFCSDASRIPIVQRLSCASDAADLASLAGSIGLSVSERTARRVLDGHIGALDPIIERVEIKPDKHLRPRAGKAVARNASRVRLHEDDVSALTAALESAFSEIARRYYLDPNVRASLKTGADRISVSIPIVRD